MGGVLVALGAKGPASVMSPDPNNPRGYFESLRIMKLNDKALATAGSSWDDWRAFDCARFSDVERRALEDEAAASLEQEFDGAPLIVVKDPRICRMMSLWAPALAHANYAVCPILPIRSPLEVAQSLTRRDGFSIGKGLLLWLRHVLDAEAATRNMPRSILIWSDLLGDWRSALIKLEAQTGVRFPQPIDRGATNITDFLSPDLRHHVATGEDLASDADVTEWVRDAFAAMLVLSSEPAAANALETLDRIRTEFNQAARAFANVFDAERKELEHLRILASQHHVLASQSGALARERDALACERDTLVGERDALVGERDALVGERDAWLQEVVRLRAKEERRLSRVIKRFFKKFSR